MRLTKFRAAGGHFDLALFEDHLDRTRTLVRQDRDAPHRLRQAITLKLDGGLSLPLVNELLYVGKLTVDHS